MLGAVVLYGLYLAIARALKDALPPFDYAALVYTTAGLVMLVSLAAIPSAFAPPAWPPSTARHRRRRGARPDPHRPRPHRRADRVPLAPARAIVALVSPMETLGGILIGAALMGATPSPRELCGAAIILAGTAAAILGPKGGREGAS